MTKKWSHGTHIMSRSNRPKDGDASPGGGPTVGWQADVMKNANLKKKCCEKSCNLNVVRETIGKMVTVFRAIRSGHYVHTM